jgi:TRAP-type C4-dicarboxylate transport system permease small subunit
MRLLETMLAGIAGSLLLFTVALTAADVIGRYFLGSPIPGAFQMVRAAMGVMTFAALPIVSARRQHLAADIVERAVSARMQRVFRALVGVFSLAALSLLTWRLVLQAREIARGNETLDVVNLPVAPLAYVMAAMAAAASAATLVLLIRDLSARGQS